MNPAVSFFHEHAAWSYNQATETPKQGRLRCAKALANAESRAVLNGWSFEWSVDQVTDSSDFSNDPNPWSLWLCICVDSSGSCLSSLGAIDLGRDGSPQDNPYRRVVEAELALETMEAFNA